MDINIFKIVVLGEAGVGKTCLLRRFIDDRFSYQSNTTIGCDFGSCTMEVSGNRVRLEVWDTAGEERFHSMRQNFYRGAHGILLVYDITWGGSFRNMAHWLHEVRHHCPRRANILLVGNKCDALERREVPYEEGSRFAEYCGITFCEASAMSGDNVKKVFATLALDICRRLLPPVSALPQPPPPPDSDDDTFPPNRPRGITLGDNSRPANGRPWGSCCNT